MDDNILELVAANDQTFEVDAMDDLYTSNDVCNRPSTADDRDVVRKKLVSVVLLISSTKECFHQRSSICLFVC